MQFQGIQEHQKGYPKHLWRTFGQPKNVPFVHSDRVFPKTRQYFHTKMWDTFQYCTTFLMKVCNTLRVWVTLLKKVCDTLQVSYKFSSMTMWYFLVLHNIILRGMWYNQGLHDKTLLVVRLFKVSPNVDALSPRNTRLDSKDESRGKKMNLKPPH